MTLLAALAVADLDTDAQRAALVRPFAESAPSRDVRAVHRRAVHRRALAGDRLDAVLAAAVGVAADRLAAGDPSGSTA